MRIHHPKGKRLPALEQNILKYRALEMVLILFYAENIKASALGAIRVTDKLQEVKQRLPDGTKNLFKKLWGILVSDGVIALQERQEIQRLIDYRNTIGHAIQELTFDLSRDPFAKSYLGKSRYDYQARIKLKRYREQLSQRMTHYVSELSFDALLFEHAEVAYESELKRLERKITQQIKVRKAELAALNAELSLEGTGLSGEDHPRHPRHKTKQGRLTPSGIEVCFRLFDHDKSPLAVAQLLRLSYHSAVNWHRKWKQGGGGKRSAAKPAVQR